MLMRATPNARTAARRCHLCSHQLVEELAALRDAYRARAEAMCKGGGR